MQIYKLFGSLQYKVVKISHTFGDFYNSADFTYINYTKNRLSAKANSLKRNGSDALICYASKISAKKFPSKNLLSHQNLLPRKLYKKRNFKACED